MKNKRAVIVAALKRVNQEIADNAQRGRYGAGLASEGYAGGYSDALSDVMLLMSGCYPDRRGYWRRKDVESASDAKGHGTPGVS